MFLAQRASDGQPVAIKVARADNAAAGEALLREADALAAVGVPHVPAVFDRGVLANGSAYVVMEFVKAEVLSERLAALDGPDGDRRVLAPCARDPERHRDRARHAASCIAI